LTITQLSCTPLIRLTAFAMLPAVFVKFAAGQVGFVCCGALVTLTWIVQAVGAAVLAPTVTLATVIVAAPAVAVTVPPEQLLTMPGTAATCNPAGRLSVKLTCCAGLLAAGLVIVNVRTVDAPILIVVGLNDFVNVALPAFVNVQATVFPTSPPTIVSVPVRVPAV
jgi:hypothetical protein